MPKFIQAKLLNPEIDYGYQLYITSLPELIDYFEQVKSTEFAAGFSDVFHKNFVQNIDGHNTTEMGRIFNARAKTICAAGNPKNESMLDVVIGVSGQIFQKMAEIVIKHGNILVGIKGGYNFAYPGLIETYGQIIERDEYLWPNDNPVIEIKKWPGGKHWYAYVNNQEVGSKFDYHYQAEEAVAQHKESQEEAQ